MIYIIGAILFIIPILILFPTKVIGRNRLPKKQGVIIAVNHYSNFDGVLMEAILPGRQYFLAKQELFKNKLLGCILKGVGCFPLNRQKSDISSIRFALKKLSEKKMLVLFPEGTRNKEEKEEMNEFKHGIVLIASKAGVPIIPVFLYKKPRMFIKNYLYIGEPFNPEGENPKRLTKEEMDDNTQRLYEKMQEAKINLIESVPKLKKKHDKNTK